MSNILELIIGVISGAVSGLGLGGGTVLIMLMSYFLDYSQQTLQTMNLLYYIPTTLIAGIVYAKKKYVDYRIGILIIVAAVIGAYVGSNIAVNIDTNLLRRIFAIYLIIVGGIFLLKRTEKQ